MFIIPEQPPTDKRQEESRGVILEAQGQNQRPGANRLLWMRGLRTVIRSIIRKQ